MSFSLKLIPNKDLKKFLFHLPTRRNSYSFSFLILPHR
ncbi:hypothetical protein FORC47_p206 (plasmid) [Bacillus cereus]|nr:hypothetical protein FORC47_p206 [Bacillus cereus]